MKIFILSILLFTLGACVDGTVENGNVLLDSDSNGSGLYHVPTGIKAFGFAKVKFTTSAGLDAGDSVGVLVRANSQDNMYACVLYDDGGTIRAVIVSKIGGGQTAISETDIGPIIGSHELGCEVLADTGNAGSSFINLWLDGTRVTGASVTDADLVDGYVGFLGVDGGDHLDDIKLSDFSFAATGPSSLAIGDSYAGGKVAYIDGLNGVISALTDNATIRWGDNTTAIGVTAQSTTDGKANTTAIVGALGAGTTYAAGVCDAYEIDAAGNSPCVAGNLCYNDWYLPSGGESFYLFQARATIGNFASASYWTSQESDGVMGSTSAHDAILEDFSGMIGADAAGDKASSQHVRCVRAY